MYKSLKYYLASSLALAVTFLMLSSSIQAQETQKTTPTDSNAKTVVDVVKSNNDVSKFAEMMDQSGFAEVLEQQKSTFTVLAPKNGAVENVDPQMKQDPKMLVQGQLFQGEIPKDKVEAQMDVKVEETDKSASNGTVYVVDKFASPPQQHQ